MIQTGKDKDISLGILVMDSNIPAVICQEPEEGDEGLPEHTNVVCRTEHLNSLTGRIGEAPRNAEDSGWYMIVTFSLSYKEVCDRLDIHESVR